MEFITSIIFDVCAMLVTLGILVTFHEFGHFWVARKCGVKVEKFSIGFGKPLLSWRERPKNVSSNPAIPDDEGTEFVIAGIPLGGYVKMLGEQEHAVSEEQKPFAFNHKPLSQRAAIVAAGPLANFLLAIMLYWAIFMNGVTDFVPVVGTILPDSMAASAGLEYGDEILAVDDSPTQTWQEVRKQLLDRLGETGIMQLRVLKAKSTLIRDLDIPLQAWLAGDKEPNILGSLGITPIYLDIPPRIGIVESGGRAKTAGFREGDLVLSANGEPINDWNSWVGMVRESPETDMTVTLERGGQVITLTLRPAIRFDETGNPALDQDARIQGFIGAGVDLPVLPQEMIREIRFSPIAALRKAVSETWENSVFVLVAIKKMIIGLMSVNNISGPITIAQIAGESVSDGLEYYIGFLALLSISLGVMNLLPIPVLDGGHLFYYAIEAVIRKPLPQGVQEFGLRFGVMMLAGIMLIAFYNDINRLL